MGSFSWRRPEPRQLVESAKHIVEDPASLDPVTPNGIPLPVGNTRGSGKAARNAFGHFAEDAGGVSVGRDGVRTSGGGASTTIDRGGYTNVAHQEGHIGGVQFTHGGSSHIGRDGVHYDEDTSIRGGGSGVTVGTSGVHGNLGDTSLSVDRGGVSTSGGGASTTTDRGGYTNVAHQEGHIGGVQFTHGGSSHIGRGGVHYDEDTSIRGGGSGVTVGTSGVHGNLGDTSLSVDRDGVSTSGGGASTTIDRGGYTNVAHQEGHIGGVQFTHGGSSHVGRDGVHYDENTSIGVGGRTVSLGTDGLHVDGGGAPSISGRSIVNDARTAFGHFAEDAAGADAAAAQAAQEEAQREAEAAQQAAEAARREAEAAQREAEAAARAAQEEAEREAEAALRATEEAERAAEEEAQNAADNAGGAAEDTGNAVVNAVTNNGNGWW